MSQTGETNDRPVFEIMGLSTHIKIWADGRIEGVPGQALVHNRIPQLLAETELAARGKKPIPFFVATGPDGGAGSTGAPAPEQAWTEWFGGAAPVRLSAPVDVILGDGKQYSDIASSFDFNWGDDILKRVKQWRRHVPPAPANALPISEERWRERPINAGMLADVLDNRTDRITAHVLMHDLIHLAKVSK